MDKLQEIFKDNTYLLDEPEVKELISYCKLMYAKAIKRNEELNKFYDFVLEKCMYSEVILRYGTDSKTTIKSILEYIDNEP